MEIISFFYLMTLNKSSSKSFPFVLFCFCSTILGFMKVTRCGFSFLFIVHKLKPFFLQLLDGPSIQLSVTFRRYLYFERQESKSYSSLKASLAVMYISWGISYHLTLSRLLCDKKIPSPEDRAIEWKKQKHFRILKLIQAKNPQKLQLFFSLTYSINE